MVRRCLCLLIVAGACGGSGDADDEPSHTSSGGPEEWDPLACAWEDRVDGGGGILDEAHKVALAANGDVLVAGSVHPSNEDVRMWLRRYSATGEVLWTNDDATEPLRSVMAMAVDEQGRLGLTGSIWDDYDGDFWVAEYEANGDVAWSVDRNTGGYGEAACFTPTGELYVTGGILDPEDSSSLYATEIWVGKFAADGTLLWQTTEGGLQPGQTEGHALVCDPSGGVVVLGSKVGADSYGGAWIRRYSPEGEALWTREVTNPRGTDPQAMVAGPADGELLVTVHILDHTQLYRIDLADGAIRSDSLAPDQFMLGADEGGLFVDGHFVRKTDPECDFADYDCELIRYYGYAYLDWDGEPIWWRADTSGIPNDEARNEMHSLAIGDGFRVLAGAVEDDVWVCHE